jgi:hypothetical protein
MEVQTRSEFRQMKLLRAEDDPDPWITKMETLRRRNWSLGVTISDEDAIFYNINIMTQLILVKRLKDEFIK